jgi:hypothetical protein
VSVGVLAAIGVVVACRRLGPVAVLVAFAALDLVLLSMTWSTATEAGRPDRWRGLGAASGWSFASVAVLGLVTVLHGWALVVVVATAVTSPMLRPSRWSRRVREAARRAQTRREFDEIVTFAYQSTPRDDQEQGT